MNHLICFKSAQIKSEEKLDGDSQMLIFKLLSWT